MKTTLRNHPARKEFKRIQSACSLNTLAYLKGEKEINREAINNLNGLFNKHLKEERKKCN